MTRKKHYPDQLAQANISYYPVSFAHFELSGFHLLHRLDRLESNIQYKIHIAVFAEECSSYYFLQWRSVSDGRENS